MTCSCRNGFKVKAHILPLYLVNSLNCILQKLYFSDQSQGKTDKGIIGHPLCSLSRDLHTNLGLGTRPPEPVKSQQQYRLDFYLLLFTQFPLFLPPKVTSPMETEFIPAHSRPVEGPCHNTQP